MYAKQAKCMIFLTTNKTITNKLQQFRSFIIRKPNVYRIKNKTQKYFSVLFCESICDAIINIQLSGPLQHRCAPRVNIFQLHRTVVRNEKINGQNLIHIVRNKRIPIPTSYGTKRTGIGDTAQSHLKFIG